MNSTKWNSTSAHTRIVDHWDHHSVHRDCSFPRSIVLGVWGFSWFHSIRYKIKKKKITFSKIFANRTEEVQSLFDSYTSFSIDVKKNLSFQKNRFERTIILYISFYIIIFFCYCCKILSKFLQQELSVFYQIYVRRLICIRSSEYLFHAYCSKFIRVNIGPFFFNFF